MGSERRTVKMNFRITTPLGEPCFEEPDDVSWHRAQGFHDILGNMGYTTHPYAILGDIPYTRLRGTGWACPLGRRKCICREPRSILPVIV
jgi:hypothetical protein